jgi:hypothetical protein
MLEGIGDCRLRQRTWRRRLVRQIVQEVKSEVDAQNNHYSRHYDLPPVEQGEQKNCGPCSKDRGGAMEALIKASPENPSPSNDKLYEAPANRRLSQTAHFHRA